MGTGAISTEFCHVFLPETTPFAACLAALLIPFFVTLTNLRSKDLTTLPEVLVFPILLAIDHSSRTRVTSLATPRTAPGDVKPWKSKYDLVEKSVRDRFMEKSPDSCARSVS
jgi:hypothetical protein